MSKSEMRKARKVARTEGRPFVGELALDRDQGPMEFTDTPRGRVALERWARRYDALNGAPEGDWDR